MSRPQDNPLSEVTDPDLQAIHSAAEKLLQRLVDAGLGLPAQRDTRGLIKLAKREKTRRIYWRRNV